jgi:diacylglycerol kinase (ATP)
VRAAVIINPIAGLFRRRGEGQRRATLARRILRSEGVEADVHLTEAPGHARALAAEASARGVDVVIAWGGDGTVNEVGATLAFGLTPVGIVPGGSGNGLARALAIPRAPAEALRHAIRATSRAIDVGEIDGRLFLNVAGVGFDAHIAHRFSRAHGARGFRRYFRLVTRDLLSYETASWRVAVDADSTESRLFLLTIANGSQWGNGAIVAPGARLDDGLLDLVSVDAPSRFELLRSIPRLFTGTLDRSPVVSVRRVTAARISGEVPLLYHFDGEPILGQSPDLLVRVHPAALRVRA